MFLELDMSRCDPQGPVSAKKKHNHKVDKIEKITGKVVAQQNFCSKGKKDVV